MKKIFNFIGKTIMFFLLIFVVSCSDNEVEPIFEQSINERTEALKSNYQDILTKPQNGWIGYYSPNNTFGAYAMVMDFDRDGYVKINSDYNNGADDNTITYRLDKTLKIEMVLESFAVFHEIFSLNNNSNQGEFVFNILSASDEEIILESKLDYGNDITILTLRPADSDASNFESVYESEENIAGDGTQSVFRNILLNEDVIGTFSFNPDTRLTMVSYVNADGVIVSKSAPIAITPSGFYFLSPLEINGTVLSDFTFDDINNEYVNTAKGLKIIYDIVPGIPLAPYKFGEIRNNARYNFLEPNKSSLAFRDLYNQLTAQFTADTGGFTISRVYMRSLNDGTIPYIQFYIPTSTGDFRAYYDIEITIVDGIASFNLTGPTNAPGFIDVALQPLINLFIGSSSGYYIKGTGGLQTFTNGTFSLINVDNPSIEINYYDF